MIDPSFRDALLKQNGEKPVEAQLAILDELMSTHRRYVRRLTIWPIVGWAACVVVLSVGLGVPIVMTVLFCLPLVGVVLLIIMIAARRSATMTQIQASLASIDAQLKLILRQQTPPSGPEG
jgi:hypothetical protein